MELMVIVIPGECEYVYSHLLGGKYVANDGL